MEVTPVDTLGALQEQFQRIRQKTDFAWEDLEDALMEERPTKLLEQNYQSWASLLLRYHEALQKAGIGSSEDSPLPSMKGSAPGIGGASVPSERGPAHK